MDAHTALINLFNELGYTSDEDGCCHGATFRWIEAFFLDEEHLFHERVERIKSLGKQFIPTLHAVLLKKGENLTEDDKKILEILAFFDSLKIYQDPEDCSLLFHHSHLCSQRHLNIISKFAASEKIKNRGNLVSVYSENLLYNSEDIKTYLDDLGRILEDHSPMPGTKFAIPLTTLDHTLTLAYVTGIGWKFMDINKYPVKTFAPEETQLIADQIFDSLKENGRSFLAFNTSIISLGNSPFNPKLQEDLNKLKIRNKINPLSVPQIDGVDLLMNAARCGDQALVEVLATAGVNLNHRHQNATAAHLAAMYGHHHVIDTLAKYHADLGAQDDEWTPIFYAADGGFEQMIEVLAVNKVNLNQPTKGVTPALAATKRGYSKALAALAQHGADLNSPDPTGYTPALAAVNKEDPSLVAELIKFGGDFNHSINTAVNSLNKTTPEIVFRYQQVLGQKKLMDNAVNLNAYEIAYILGNAQVLKLLSLEKEIHWFYQNILNFCQHIQLNENQLDADCQPLRSLTNRFIKALYDPEERLNETYCELKSLLQKLSKKTNNPGIEPFLDHVEKVFTLKEPDVIPIDYSFFKPVQMDTDPRINDALALMH